MEFVTLQALNQMFASEKQSHAKYSTGRSPHNTDFTKTNQNEVMRIRMNFWRFPNSQINSWKRIRDIEFLEENWWQWIYKNYSWKRICKRKPNLNINCRHTKPIWISSTKNLTLYLGGGIRKLKTFCEKKTSFKLFISIPKLTWLKRNNSIFTECFSRLHLGHARLLDFKGFLQHVTLTDTELFFGPWSLTSGLISNRFYMYYLVTLSRNKMMNTFWNILL